METKQEKTNDELINDVLLFLNSRRAGQHLNYFLASLDLDKKKGQLIKDLMEHRGLMEKTIQQLRIADDSYKISAKGIGILAEHGDYLSFLRHQNRINMFSKAKVIVSMSIAAASLIFAIIIGVLNYLKNDQIDRKDAIIESQSITIDLLKAAQQK